MFFICPICRRPLSRLGGACVCPNGHSYDIAAEGYIHLLPPNKMHAKIPGDSRQMVAARRNFLATGLYEPFSDALNGLVAEAVRGLESPQILDAGCGEGYYTGRLREELTRRGIRAQIAGFDISKFAVKAAARRCRGIEFAVGSIFDIPAASASADCVLNVFAPLVPGEFLRVLRPGGTLIIAVPGARHLFGLKRILYDEPYENECKDTVYDGFVFQKRVPVRGKIEIRDKKVMQDLFAMTPYYWKTPPEGGERLRKTELLRTEIGFDFLVYRRTQACAAAPSA